MSGGGSSRQGPGAPLVGRDEDVEFIHSFVNQAAIPPGETGRAPGRWCAVFANRDDPAVRELKMLYDAVAPSSCPAGWQADLTAVARPRAPWARTRTWSVRRMPRGARRPRGGTARFGRTRCQVPVVAMLSASWPRRVI